MKHSVVTITLNPALDKTVTLLNLQIGGLNRVQDMRTDPGGKGINVAKVLKKFDVDVIATGMVSGVQGQQILEQLRKEGIENYFTNVSGETRTNLKIVDEKTKITTEINEPGFIVSPEDLADFQRKLSVLLDRASFLVIAGSLPTGVPESIYRDFINMANSKGVKTIFDADGAALKAGIEAVPYAVKPNIYELEQLIGCKLAITEEIVSAGKKLIDSGISLVMISMGSQGSIVLNRDEAYRVSPFSINPQSTVGAGDSMVAMLAYSLLENKTLAETAVWATAAGTVTASKSGTQVCTLEEVQSNLTGVEISKILNRFINKEGINKE